ncbi:hypothetical protein CYMTET_29293 [Cymbomonas tetramitiformis]|uniref:Uncharacterized protein n=1 Tax=Cymbomonas tetramitiformis TaxID=36881 RepID=A0AAE0FL35_9CHLO|nr:hypothetical protein CYMTET_29293 [Cymbomonas tetramitiformis]
MSARSTISDQSQQPASLQPPSPSINPASVQQSQTTITSMMPPLQQHAPLSNQMVQNGRPAQNIGICQQILEAAAANRSMQQQWQQQDNLQSSSSNLPFSDTCGIQTDVSANSQSLVAISTAEAHAGEQLAYAHAFSAEDLSMIKMDDPTNSSALLMSTDRAAVHSAGSKDDAI